MKILIIKIFQYLIKFLFPKKKFFLRILMFHDINQSDFKKFELILKNLKKKYKFVNPKNLSSLSGFNNILVTFDDGYLSSYNFSKKILDKYNIKSIFFIVSDLLEKKNEKKILKRILGESKKFENKIFLEKKHVKKLIKNGHSIGIHGKSHQKLSKINSNSMLNKEILQPKEYFKSKFNVQPKFYAFSYGSIDSIKIKSIKIILRNYDYLFTGIRGFNYKSNIEKRFFFRDNVEKDFDCNTLDFFINGYADILYAKSRNKFIMFISQLSNFLKQ